MRRRLQRLRANRASNARLTDHDLLPAGTPSAARRGHLGVNQHGRPLGDYHDADPPRSWTSRQTTSDFKVAFPEQHPSTLQGYDGDRAQAGETRKTRRR
jgi:hypothetical protein